MKDWRIALAQINCTVGDLKGNSAKIRENTEKARELGVDVIAFPELAITGYPPEDLVLKPKFIEDNLKALDELSKSIQGIVAIVGFVNRIGGDVYNAASVIYDRTVKGVCHKTLLPNYGVFDEKRYFAAGREPLVFKLGELVFAVSICEDIWFREGPTRFQAMSGTRLVFNINASPYHMGKTRAREDIVRERVRENDIFVSYTNLVGGQDELVFDGQSFVMEPGGTIVAQALAFEEDLLLVDLPCESLIQKRSGEDGAKLTCNVATIDPGASPKEKKRVAPRQSKTLDPAVEVYQALLLGLRDYVVKNGFHAVTVGLSGGIDSALVAVLAVDALGKERVSGVFMPSRFTSQTSETDARELADNLGMRLLEIPIDLVYKAYLSVLEPRFAGLAPDITEENIQARIRGNLLMALSNKFGWLVLTTGNKSEMSVGYATLYGDMAGGFAVIKDVPKTLVYELAAYRNSLGQVIPDSILTKEPTAELKPDQKDTDTLPPYSILDKVLKEYIEEDKTTEEIVSLSMEREIVQKVSSMVDRSEYKRRQSSPGIKITPKAFGRDRRMPITNRYKG